MIDLAAKLAAALMLTAGLATTAIAAPVADLAVGETPIAADGIEVAEYCQYITQYSAWGTPSWVYVCY